MKSIYLVIANIFLILSLQGQIQVWQADVDVLDVNLRQPNAIVLQSMELDLPEDGKVMVKFEGNIWSSKGDVITLAVSNYTNWQTNDGNVGVYVYDTLRRLNTFHHTRIYSVSKGFNTFYALGHNWTDKNGNGIATVKGKLTIEYIPSSVTPYLIFHKGIKKYPLLLNEMASALDTFNLNIPSKGKILVAMDGKASSNANNELSFSTSLDGQWQNEEEEISVFSADTDDLKILSYRKIYTVEEGPLQVFLLAKKILGNMSSSNNSLYLTISVEFIPDEVETLRMASQKIDQIILKSDTIKDFAHINFNTDEKGKAIVHFTGSIKSHREDIVTLSLLHDKDNDIELTALNIQPIHANDDKTFFSMTGIADLEAGFNQFKLNGIFENGSSGNGLSEIKGQLFVKFIPEKETTTSTFEIDSAKDFTIFPNPTSERIFIYTDLVSVPTELTIYSMGGYKMMFIKNIDYDGQGIDISTLPDGQYLLKFDNDKKWHKIIKISQID